MNPVIRNAVILAAGKGTRLREVSGLKPKVMMDVDGLPLLERHILWLREYGVERLFINLHWMPEAITDHFGDGSRLGVSIHYSREAELAGTAGALRGFRSGLDETFLVHYGDVYSELDVAAMARRHREAEADATLAVHPSSHPHDSDIVEIDADDRITALHHKPGDERFGNLGNAACYLLEPTVLEYVPAEGAADFIRDVFPPMLAAGRRLAAYHNRDFVMDMGTPDRYERLLQRLTARDAQRRSA